jgi:hypothetical protein
MTPVVNDPSVKRLRLQAEPEEMRRTVHFGHPPGRYLLVGGANSTVAGTYVFGTGPRAAHSIFWSPYELHEAGAACAIEVSSDLEGACNEIATNELANPGNQNPFADLDAVIAAIRQSTILPAPTSEVASLVTRAVQLQGAVPTDVEQWARQLATDVADLTD